MINDWSKYYLEYRIMLYYAFLDQCYIMPYKKKKKV